MYHFADDEDRPPPSSERMPPSVGPTPSNPATPASVLAHMQEGSGITPALQNIVSTVNLGCKLDLKVF